MRGIYRPEVQTPSPLAIGLVFHACRARWFGLNFATGTDAWKELQTVAEEEANRQRLPVALKSEQFALSIMQQYVEWYGKRPKPQVIAAEYDIGPALLQGSDGKDLPFSYRTARLDDVSKYPEGGNGLYVGEAKTTSDSVEASAKEYELHGQTLLQAALWRAAPQGEVMHGPIRGIMLDVVVKGYGGEKCKFGRVPLQIPPFAIDWYVKDLALKVRRAAAISWDSHVEHNVSMCTRMAGRKRMDCPFKDLCRHGQTASGKYVLPGGKSLLSHKPEQGKEQKPWE